MKLSTSTLRTCLVALDAAYDREESVTAKLRISNASREISEVLAAGPQPQHMLDHTTVADDGVQTLFCKCGFSSVNSSTLRDHIMIASDNVPGTGPFLLSELFPATLPPGKVTYVITCQECGCVVQNSHEPVEKHVAWHNKVANL